MKPKTSTSQKPSDAERERHRWLDWEDGLANHCRTLLTLAGLLTRIGEDGLPSDVAGDTGALIEREVKQLKAVVKARPGGGVK